VLFRRLQRIECAAPMPSNSNWSACMTSTDFHTKFSSRLAPKNHDGFPEEGLTEMTVMSELTADQLRIKIDATTTRDDIHMELIEYMHAPVTTVFVGPESLRVKIAELAAKFDCDYLIE
jgi:hypothetical protein